jgi:hypothetical protein
MARRPKRTLDAELAAHQRIAEAASATCTALVALEPEIAEFMVARKMLDDGVKELQRKRDEAAAVPVQS